MQKPYVLLDVSHAVYLLYVVDKSFLTSTADHARPKAPLKRFSLLESFRGEAGSGSSTMVCSAVHTAKTSL